MSLKNPLKATGQKDSRQKQLQVLKSFFYSWSEKDYLDFCKRFKFKVSINKSISQLKREKYIFDKAIKESSAQAAQAVLVSRRKVNKNIKHFKREVYQELLEQDSKLIHNHFRYVYYRELSTPEQRKIFLDIMEFFKRDFKKMCEDCSVCPQEGRGAHNNYLSAIARLVKLSPMWIKSLEGFDAKGSLSKKFKALVDFLLVKYKCPSGLYFGFFSLKDESLFFTKIAAGASLKNEIKSNIVFFKSDISQVIKKLQSNSLSNSLRLTQYKRADLRPRMIHQLTRNAAFSGEASKEIESLKWEFVLFMGRQEFFDEAQVSPLWDYILHLRANTRGKFKLLGRNINNLMEGMEAWHKELSELKVDKDYAWAPRFMNIFSEEKIVDDLVEKIYIQELTSYSSLVKEGKSQRHCVASYARRCQGGFCSILSLRIQVGGEIDDTIATIEVDNSQGAVVQAKGRGNKELDHKSYNFIYRWAVMNNLEVKI